MFNQHLTRTVILLVTGFIFVVIGGILTLFWKDIWRLINKKALQTSPSMLFYKEWEEAPTYILNKLYLFNWTNPNEFGLNGTVPILKEIGPYTFREYQKKINVTWNPNHTVSYRVHRKWYFDPELSQGSLDDNFTTLNVIPVVAADFTKHWNPYIQRGLSLLLTVSGEEIVTTKSVRVMAFEGYKYSLAFIAKYLYPKYSKFGYFHVYNDSSYRDGYLNVGTGSNPKDIGKVFKWDFSDELRGLCDKINGTTGEQFSPELPKDSITIFTPWLCRDLYLDYQKEESVNHVVGYKFVAGKANMDNSTTNPRSACSWPEKSFPSGITNISTCYENAPVVASYPHFFLADPYYTSQVKGMRPDPEKHESSFVIEPVTGVPLKGKFAMQINVLVNNYSTIKLYQNIQPMVFPILWLEKTIEIPEYLTRTIYYYLSVINIIDVVAEPLLITGICILILTVIWSMKGSDVVTLNNNSTTNRHASIAKDMTHVLVVKTYNFVQSSHENHQ